MKFDITTKEINELCHLTYCADKETRSDLAKGYIAKDKNLSKLILS